MKKVLHSRFFYVEKAILSKNKSYLKMDIDLLLLF